MASVIAFNREEFRVRELEVSLTANASITRLRLTAPAGSFTISAHIGSIPKLVASCVVPPALSMIELCLLQNAECKRESVFNLG